MPFPITLFNRYYEIALYHDIKFSDISFKSETVFIYIVLGSTTDRDE